MHRACAHIWPPVTGLKERNGGGLSVVHALTMPHPSGWAGYTRPVDAGMLAQSSDRAPA